MYYQLVCLFSYQTKLESKEDLSAALQKQKEQCKKLEGKLSGQ